MFKIILLVLFILVFLYASTEDFKCGFNFGYRDEIRGISGDGKIDRLSVIPTPTIKPVTPIGKTDYEVGVDYGRKAAEKRIYERLNSYQKKRLNNHLNNY